MENREAKDYRLKCDKVSAVSDDRPRNSTDNLDVAQREVERLQTEIVQKQSAEERLRNECGRLRQSHDAVSANASANDQ